VHPASNLSSYAHIHGWLLPPLGEGVQPPDIHTPALRRAQPLDLQEQAIEVAPLTEGAGEPAVYVRRRLGTKPRTKALGD